MKSVAFPLASSVFLPGNKVKRRSNQKHKQMKEIKERKNDGRDQ